jgi:hypothetical protein
MKYLLCVNFGYNMFSTDTLDEYKVNPKGMTYGGTYNITENASAVGAALRFSFEVLSKIRCG